MVEGLIEAATLDLRIRNQEIRVHGGGRRHTFAQFQDRISRRASALQKLGVQAGDRVGILSLNSDRYVEFFMAVPWAGAAVNPVNTRWSAAEIAYSLDDCDTQVLLVDDPFLPLLPELLARTSSLRTLIHVGDGPTPDGMLSYETLLTEAKPVPDARRGGTDLAGVFYTGGTTGFPKGVMLSHDGLCQNSLFAVAEGMARAGAIGLHAAPLFHIAAITVLGFLWAVGGTHVTLPSFTPLGVLQAIERERISTTVLVPTMIQMTVDHPEAAGFDLSSLETLVYGASPISEALVERATTLMPTTQLIQIYGMTEMAPIMTTLAGAFLAAGLVDELIVYLAPCLLGNQGRGMFALGELTALSDRVQLRILDVTRVGEDLRLIARPRGKD